MSIKHLAPRAALPFASSHKALLLGLAGTTLLAAPAFAQAIETVVVTAQKRAEDVQEVPIAISAFTASDLAERQITQYKDIQFATPSVNFTKTNFTAANFSIRGIGTQIISTDSEFGVAFNINDVYYQTPPMDSAQFYDLHDVEVLRGPQSTLYGRGATGGAVNVTTARPVLDAFAADGWATYGNYNSSEVRGMINMPIVEGTLGLRLAGDWVRHDGFTRNIYPGAADADGRDLWSLRASLRWQPSARTTIDFIAGHSAENDSRMRAQKQLCDTDPTGVLGCLPDAVRGGSGAVNLNATFLSIPVSRQALGAIFTPLYSELFTQQYEAAGVPAGAAAALAATAAAATAPGLGITDLAQPYAAPAGAVPRNARTINSDVDPLMKNRSNNLTLEARQTVNDWLDATLVAGYADTTLVSQESYVNSPGATFNPLLLGTSRATLQNTIGAYALAGLVPPAYASPTAGPYAFVLDPGHAGTLPTSNFNNLGIIGGAINRYTANQFAYDQSDGQFRQTSFELRFASHLEGPVNFLAAAYYLHADSPTDYYIGANTLDYGQTLFGALLGPVKAAPLCANARGCIYGTPYYHNDGTHGIIDSKAVYGEVYYDVVPDKLKLTGGLRYTEDLKHYQGRIDVFNGFIPAGSTNETAALAALVAQQQYDFDGGAPGYQTYQYTSSKFGKLTGRAVATWTPEVDFTDRTMIYASYARGYKAGGSNPGVQTSNLAGIPASYAPESIDAYEIGTKNTLLNGTLQANLTAWYYDYRNYQISSIVANTSVNTNIDARLDGLEAEFKIAPTERLQFSLSGNLTESSIGDTSQIDTRNPTGGYGNALLLKDGTLSPTNAANCVLYYSGSNFAGDFAALSSLSRGLFFAPPGGTGALAGSGVAHAAYGSCYTGTNAADPFYGLSLNNPQLAALLAGTHFSQTNPAIGGSLTGVPVKLKGRHLALVSPGSLSFGAQYTQPLDSGFALVGRIDWYWQAAMFGQIFNDPADRISSYGTGNLKLSLVAPDKDWAVEAYVRNVFGSSNMTGEYLAAATQGLFTGAFYGDPRLYGVAVSANF
jgi:outer membrane receptor protein involved in Fe transport